MVVDRRNRFRNLCLYLNRHGNGGRVPQKASTWSKDAVIGYLIHGVTAVIALWMFMKAVGQTSEVEGVSGDRMEEIRTERHPKYYRDRLDLPTSAMLT